MSALVLVLIISLIGSVAHDLRGDGVLPPPPGATQKTALLPPPPALVASATVSMPSSTSVVTPAPSTPPVLPIVPEQVTPVAVAAVMAAPPAAEESKPQLLDAKPLFAAAASSVGSDGQKEMYEKTADDESRARAALVAIEKLKDDRTDAYLSFDAELDGIYDSSGLTKGNASQALSEAKEHIIIGLAHKTAADNSAEALVAEQSLLIGQLEQEVKKLQECEKAIFIADEILSKYVLELGDSVVQITSWRNAIEDALNPAVAADLANKIKVDADKVVAAQASIIGASGQAKAVDDALAAAKKQIEAVKKIIEDLKKKDVNLADIMKKISVRTVESSVDKPTELPTDKAVEQSSVESSDVESAPVGTEDEGKKKTKKRKITESSWRKMLRGTVFEVPFVVLSDTVTSLSEAMEPVVSFAYCFGLSVYHNIMQVFGASNSIVVPEIHTDISLDDPVLERIRIERNQSQEKVQELVAQRELIELKDALLDRLEAERVMQLDSKEKIKEEMTRAYARKDRELSWLELFKRLAWKSYAATRRLIGRTIAWWQGKEYPEKRRIANRGRGEEKVEPK